MSDSVGRKLATAWDGGASEHTIAIFVLRGYESALKAARSDQDRHTNREKASLNSDTCSSVRESACDHQKISEWSRRVKFHNYDPQSVGAIP